MIKRLAAALLVATTLASEATAQDKPAKSVVGDQSGFSEQISHARQYGIGQNGGRPSRSDKVLFSKLTAKLAPAGADIVEGCYHSPDLMYAFALVESGIKQADAYTTRLRNVHKLNVPIVDPHLPDEVYIGLGKNKAQALCPIAALQ